MEYRLFLILAPIAATILLFTMVSTWKYREEPVGHSLLWYFFLVILFLSTNLSELLSKSEFWTLFWAKTQHPIIALLPVAWVSFALNYTGINTLKIKKSIRLLILIIPVISSISAIMYPRTVMYYQSHSFSEFDGYSTIDPIYGPWFWITGAFMYILLIAGVLIILRYILSKRSSTRVHIIWIISGILFPILINFLYILPLPVFLHKDYTPLAFAASGIFFFIDIYWFRLLQIIPLARNIALEEMENGILILDKRKCIVDFNNTILRMLSLSNNILGSTIDNIPILAHLIKDSISDNQTVYEATFDDNHGTRNCDVFIKEIHNPQYNHLGILITISDVTSRVKLIEEKMKLVSALEKTNKELHVAQLQLVHREKLASIGQVSAGVAHELRNPVSFLQSNYRVLRTRLLQMENHISAHLTHENTEEIREILDDSDEGFRRILDVVNNLLLFSNPMDTSRSKKVVYDLHSGLDNTLKIIRGLIIDPARIEKNYGDIPHILCYKNELNQVFLNILTNAAHAINGCLDKQGTIRIETEHKDNSVICSITNNGPPIEPKILERIFEPFYTTKQAGKGTGLGLSIARDIIEKRHNGYISAISDIHTTTFTIKLPIPDEKGSGST